MISDHVLVGCGNCSYMIPDAEQGTFGRASVSFSSRSRRQNIFFHSNLSLSLSIPLYPTVLSMCKSRSPKRNPDFSRKYRGSSSSSKNKRQSQERDIPESLEDATFPSKNGPLTSFSNNQRYSATAAPGRREKEIVELFRKVQSQLRERAAIKEEKMVESAHQSPKERGTVDSLLKLLRKHSVTQAKKSSASDEEYDLDEPERSNPFDGPETTDLFDEEPPPQSDFVVSDTLGDTHNDVHEPKPGPFPRPISRFKRKSPVPKVRFQPVFSTEDERSVAAASPGDGSSELLPEVVEPQAWQRLLETGTKIGGLDDDSESSMEPLVISGLDEADTGRSEMTMIEGADLSAMKVSELRGLAKDRGIKGYSKLKKVELLELLR